MSESSNKANYVKGVERRKHIRIPFRFPIRHRPSGTLDYFYSDMGNLSIGGMMFYSPKPYEKGTEIELEILYPFKAPSQSLTIQGIVVWIRQSHINQEELCIGIQFKELSDHQRKLLQILIQEYLKLKDEGLVTESINKVFVEKQKQARTFFLEGLKKFRKEDLDGAMKDFSNTIELDPTHSAAYSYRAFCKDRKGDAKGTEQDFIKAQELGGL